MLFLFLLLLCFPMLRFSTQPWTPMYLPSAHLHFLDAQHLPCDDKIPSNKPVEIQSLKTSKGKQIHGTGISSWWLNQPIWKICSSKWESFPRFGVKIEKYLKPPPSIICYVPQKNQPYIDKEMKLSSISLENSNIYYWKSSDSMFRFFTTFRREKIVGEQHFRSFFEVCRWSMGLVPSLKPTYQYPLKMDPWKRRFLLETTNFEGYVMLVWGSVYIYDPARETAPHKQELTPQQWHCPPKLHFAILRTQRNVDKYKHKYIIIYP